MSRYVLLRLLDTFFRLWWLVLLPVVLLVGAGAWVATSQQSEYESAGTINVASETLIGSLTSTGINYGYRTPADVTASNLYQLLQTGEFIKQVATAAGVSGALDSGALRIADIRSSINVSTGGDNLVHISALNTNAELAQRLAEGTMDAFRQYEIDRGVSDSQAAIDFFQQQVTEYQAALDTAQANYDAYLTDHPAQLDGSYTTEEQVAIQRLNDLLNTAQNRVDGAQSSLDDAQLTKAQATTGVNQRLTTVDEPELPTSHQPRLKKMLTTVVTFGFLGALLGLGILVIAAATDRTIRFPFDTGKRLGVPSIATVPKVAR